MFWSDLVKAILCLHSFRGSQGFRMPLEPLSCDPHLCPILLGHIHPLLRHMEDFQFHEHDMVFCASVLMTFPLETHCRLLPVL